MATKSDVTLEDIAVELHALPPKEFTAARDARAKQMSDTVLAEEIRSLRKPQLSAWVVNLFARERPDALAQALDLASDLREAHDDLDVRALTALGRQRRVLVARWPSRRVSSRVLVPRRSLRPRRMLSSRR